MLEDLQAWADEDEIIRQRGLVVQELDWDQSTADPERVARGVGVSACVYLQARSGLPALISGEMPETSRESTVQFLAEYDASGRNCAGTFRVQEVAEFKQISSRH